MFDLYTPQVCVLVGGVHNISQTGVIIINGHRMDCDENEVVELHCVLIEVITIVRVQIHTKLVGSSDTYNLEINIFEIELILNFIL